MVSFKSQPKQSDTCKYNGELNLPEHCCKFRPSILIFVGFVIIILSIAQIWAFCFLYGRLKALEYIHQTSSDIQKTELQEVIRTELGKYYSNKINHKLRLKVKRRKRNVPKNYHLQTYKDDRPEGPPIKTFNIKDWLSKGETQNANDDIYRSTRGVSETRYDEQAEEPDVQLQGQTDEENDQSWLPLTSYARIPYNTISKFCSKTRASCPAGPRGDTGHKGDAGFIGAKGEQGDRGLPGRKGLMGDIGLPGEKGQPGKRGFKGDRGFLGRNGVDGRDGLPGEPGLDGIPGRNGLDGKEGFCNPGNNGVPGQDGTNGTNGRPGDEGNQGEKGIMGQRGMTGPRGLPGTHGIKGDAGTPGKTRYSINGTDNVLASPSLADTTRTTIIQREGDALRLSCEATGFPTPMVEWAREDHSAIRTGFWKDATVQGKSLNLTYLSREHIGIYKCIAYNGVPPKSYRIFDLKVHFAPFIRVNQLEIGTLIGRNIVLHCHIEAFPQAVTYWESRDAKILGNSLKYEIMHQETSNYVWKSVMSLTIMNITKNDFGNYFCLAKNELTTTRGVVTLYEIDPNLYNPKHGKTEGMTYGPKPPDYDELFSKPCDTSNCCKQPTDRIATTNLRYCIRVDKSTNGSPHKRQKNCVLTAIGKPVYQTKSGVGFGFWMPESKKEMKKTTSKDGMRDGNKYYRTISSYPNILHEFKDKQAYRKNERLNDYKLKTAFQGNSHVIYKGSFFYHSAEEDQIVKFNFASRKDKYLNISNLDTNQYLYKPGSNYIDLNVDENGLWAIYSQKNSENTNIMKIDDDLMKEEYSLNISLNHRKFGEMFIICGVLYGIESAADHKTKISLALDLYEESILDVDLSFTNPVANTTMLSYNPKTEKLYSWADGTQLEYPIKHSA